MTEQLDLAEYNRRWVETHRNNPYQAEAARRITVLLDALEAAQAEVARWKHAYEMADPLLTDRDRLAATVERVRKVMNDPEVVNIHVGGGNLVGQKKVIFPEHLRAALGDDQ